MWCLCYTSRRSVVRPDHKKTIASRIYLQSQANVTLCVLFCFYDLDFKPMTLIYELDLSFWIYICATKMNFVHTNILTDMSMFKTLCSQMRSEEFVEVFICCVNDWRRCSTDVEWIRCAKPTLVATAPELLLWPAAAAVILRVISW